MFGRLARCRPSIASGEVPAIGVSGEVPAPRGDWRGAGHRASGEVPAQGDRRGAGPGGDVRRGAGLHQERGALSEVLKERCARAMCSQGEKPLQCAD